MYKIQKSPVRDIKRKFELAFFLNFLKIALYSQKKMRFTK